VALTQRSLKRNRPALSLCLFWSGDQRVFIFLWLQLRCLFNHLVSTNGLKFATFLLSQEACVVIKVPSRGLFCRRTWPKSRFSELGSCNVDLGLWNYDLKESSERFICLGLPRSLHQNDFIYPLNWHSWSYWVWFMSAYYSKEINIT